MGAASGGRRPRILASLAVAVALAVFFLWHPVSVHLRAMSILLRFSSPQYSGIGVRFAQHPFTEELGSAQTPWGPLRYRIYKPTDVSYPAGIVVLHGIHDLGIEEPRLRSFSHALAAAGLEVMTPELSDLADYRVTPQTVDRIGISTVILSTQMGRPKVGILGLSFSGGLALIAAARPEYARTTSFVLAVGAHDDLVRVSRFFATNMMEKPDGSSVPFQAHEYGVLILAYAHLDYFFPAQDIDTAREALKLWLHEQAKESLDLAQRLTPQGQQMFDQIVHHHDQLRPKLLQEIESHRDEMEPVSPHGHIANLNVPVFLLHGSGDNVIPPAETQWLAQDVPPQQLKRVLISPALVHVNMEDSVPFSQKWDLVDFIARMLEAAER